MDVTIDFRGPLFDRRAEAAVADFQEEAVEEIANQGYADIHFELDRVLRNPTTAYENRIQVERAVGDGWLVHDDNSLYGPWLEGVSERNRSTRFKGYHHWRRISQALQDKAPQIAQQVLDRYMGRLNG